MLACSALVGAEQGKHRYPRPTPRYPKFLAAALCHSCTPSAGRRIRTVACGGAAKHWSHQTNIIGRRVKDTLAERLRRRPAKPMGSPRVGSNPTGVVLAGIHWAHTQQPFVPTWIDMPCHRHQASDMFEVCRNGCCPELHSNHYHVPIASFLPWPTE